MGLFWRTGLHGCEGEGEGLRLYLGGEVRGGVGEGGGGERERRRERGGGGVRR